MHIRVSKFNEELTQLIFGKMLLKNGNRRACLAECLLHPFVASVTSDVHPGGQTEEDFAPRFLHLIQQKKQERTDDDSSGVLICGADLVSWSPYEKHRWEKLRSAENTESFFTRFRCFLFLGLLLIILVGSVYIYVSGDILAEVDTQAKELGPGATRDDLTGRGPRFGPASSGIVASGMVASAAAGFLKQMI